MCSHGNDEEKLGGVCVLTGMIRNMCVCSHGNDEEKVCGVCVLMGMMRMWVVCACVFSRE